MPRTEPERSQPVGRKRALIIGNSQYDDPRLPRLDTPRSDAVRLGKVLEAPSIGDFDDVKTLVNKSEATLRRALVRFFSSGKRTDLMLAYFSGHGVLDDQGVLHFATRDTDLDTLSATAVAASFVREAMDRSPSRRQVLILDCCNSGSFPRGAKSATAPSVGTAQAFDVTGHGRVVLTASDSVQHAWEGDQPSGEAAGSVFTRHLVQGLETGHADLDRDGEISLDELFEYTYEQVTSESGKQKPLKLADKQRLGKVVLAANQRVSVPLPPEVEELVADERPLVRAGAAGELGRLLSEAEAPLALTALETLERLKDEDDSKKVVRAATDALDANGDRISELRGDEAPEGLTHDPSAPVVPPVDTRAPYPDPGPADSSDSAAAGPAIVEAVSVPEAVAPDLAGDTRTATRWHHALGPTLLLSLVFLINVAQTHFDERLTPEGLGVESRYPVIEAIRWFEGELSFESHDATNDVAVKGYSISYFFIFPLVGLVVAFALARRKDPVPYRTLSLAIAIDYLISLPFFLVFPVPERWAIPESEAILLSDLWSSNLIEAIRPISGLDNCFPSFHVSMTVVVIAVCYLFDVRFRTSVLALGLTIILSTFVLGIHWIPDLVAGVVVGLFSVALAFRVVTANGTGFLRNWLFW